MRKKSTPSAEKLKNQGSRSNTDSQFRLANTYNRSLLEASLDPLVTISPDGSISDVNAATIKVTGFSREELIGTDFSNYFTEPDKAKAGYEKVFRDGSVTDYELQIRHRNGTIIPVLYNASVFKDGAGNIAGVFAAARDITERKKTEQALQTQERFLNDVLSALNDGISVQDPSMTILRVNKTIEQWYPESVPHVGKRCFEAYHQRNKPCDICPVQKTLETGKPDRALVTIKTAGKVAGWAEIFSYPMFSPETGRITGVIEHVRDITEQKCLEYTYEQEMEYYSAELKRYVETLATTNNKLNLMNSVTRHDILNTVTGLLGVIDMALAAGTKEEETAFLHDIRTLGKTIQTQIEFTRQYQDIGVQVAEWYDVRSIITSAMEHLPLNGIAVTINIDRLAIYADPLIGKVFYNIVENSIRHGEHVTRMSFDCRKADSDIVIIFSDDGVGIPIDQKEKIFLKGFGKHTGLGMFLARAILSITDITIRETGEPFQGARFEIKVPKGAYRLANAQ
jgi:PAS domain S-box-containing protein